MAVFMRYKECVECQLTAASNVVYCVGHDKYAEIFQTLGNAMFYSSLFQNLQNSA